MRLGGAVFGDVSTPKKWVDAVNSMGYRAAYCPLDAQADAVTVKAYRHAAEEADILIAEVGAWSNTLSPDTAVREKAMDHCKRQLDLAERIGARTCVNIAGGCGTQWDGPHPDNLTSETYERIVAFVQEILDTVQPEKSFYSLETMPWVYPHTPDAYLALVKDIDRKQFKAHLDPVNMINSPVLYLQNAAFLNECFDKLDEYIVSVHAKDIVLSEKLTVHLDEAHPGEGSLCYKTFLRRMNRLHPETPLMMEHMKEEADYRKAAAYIRRVASETGIRL